MSSFKSSENIQKKGSGIYRGFAYWMLISEPIHLASARANYRNLMELLQDSRRKDRKLHHNFTKSSKFQEFNIYKPFL